MIALMMAVDNALAQNKKHMVRIAKIEVDSAQVDAYKTAVKEIGEASLRNEPGVLMLFSVADKNKLNRITIMEVYADSAAYEAHRQTAHFKKYKETTRNMVKSLELVDVDTVFSGIKQGALSQ
jgi:quinol monooxygenase YgiN